MVGPTIARLATLDVGAPNPYGFKASFNPAFRGATDDGIGWISPFHFGINVGPTVLMIENHRSGLIWSLMKRCAPLRNGPRGGGISTCRDEVSRLSDHEIVLPVVRNCSD